MEKVEIRNTVKLSSPHLFGLLVTKDSGGRLNVMGVSWFSFASLKPPMMVMCISQKSHTSAVLDATGKATLCLVTEKIRDKALECCRCSGRDTDKFSRFDLEVVYTEGFDVPAVEGSRLSWALEVEDTKKAGDHTVYIAAIKDAALLADEKHLYAFDGYKELKTI